MNINEVVVAVSSSLAVSILAKVTVTTALALAGVRLARRSRAAIRFVVLAAAFVVLLALPIAAIIAPAIPVVVPIAAEETPAPVTRAPVMDVPPLTAAPDVAGEPAVAVRHSATPSTSVLLITGWAVGAALFLLPMVIGLWQMRSLRRSGIPWRQGRSIAEWLARDAGIRRRIEVLRHESIAGPMTCGVVHPAVVLPADAQSWAAEDLHRAIVHELEHVRRGDWMSQCLARVVCAVYWFHPLVWMARRQLMLEAERACDDAVLRRTHVEATVYADQLIGLAERLSSHADPPLLAMANRHDLATRVGAVLDNRLARGRAGAFAVVFVGAGAALLVMTMSPLRLVAETRSVAQGTWSSPVAFQVASIKPCAPGESTGGRSGGGGGGFGASPGRIFFQCMPVTEIIRRAYVQFGDPPPPNAPSLFGDLIKGAPDWASSDRYTIEAKAEGAPPTTTMMGAMLRALLADRFQLKIRQETRDVPGYALTVAKSGFKLKPVPDGTCVQPDPNYIGPRVLTASGVFTGTPGPGDKPLCTGGVGRNGANLTYDVTGQSFERVSRTLGGLVLGRPVVDRTGITGQFSFHLEFENVENVVTQPGTTVDPPDVSSVASIFSVFEKQLGLKLVAAKVPQGSLAIDRLERPTPDSAAGAATSGQAGVAAGPAQRFEVASIKPCPPEDPPPGTGGPRGTAGGTNASISPGRFTVPCVTLEQLIYLAYASYGASADQLLANDYLGTASDATKVRGGPAWVHSTRDKYAIEATASSSVSDRATLMGAMLRTLLEDRFRLVIHRASEDVPMYALRVAKSGLKLKPITDSDCDPNAVGTPPPWTTPPCGFMTNSRMGPNTRWHYVGFQLGFLARQLAGPLGRHVIDETGVTGQFIIDLAFLADDGKAPDAPGVLDGNGKPIAIDSAPSIFTAVEEQLGLKLEKTTGPRGYLVIDQVERPRPDDPIPARASGAGAGR